MCTSVSLFFFNDTATTEIYTLSLHDALPISVIRSVATHQPLQPFPSRTRTTPHSGWKEGMNQVVTDSRTSLDRKSTRLNSSHANISYAVFCLKKKKKTY